MPAAPAALVRLVVSEIVIGLFFGTITRLIMSALQLTGMIFGFQSGLSAATLFDPNQSMQSPVVANFLNLIVITMIFATDLHHLLLRGLIDTYGLFPVGGFLPVADGAQAVMRVASDSFRIGLQLSAPVLIAGFLLSLGAGLVNRLMPQMMVFFVLIPIQITGTFAVLMVTLSATVYWYLSYFDQTMAGFAAAG
jgi:flagellar biosynthetic protein FliR